MVNGWLKSPHSGPDCFRQRQDQRIFATKTALTSSYQRDFGRSEVVLDPAILGLLINRAAASPRGIKK
jgi:hypothetical protein